MFCRLWFRDKFHAVLAAAALGRRVAQHGGGFHTSTASRCPTSRCIRMAAVPSIVKKGLADDLITCITGITPQVCPPPPPLLQEEPKTDPPNPQTDPENFALCRVGSVLLLLLLLRWSSCG